MRRGRICRRKMELRPSAAPPLPLRRRKMQKVSSKSDNPDDKPQDVLARPPFQKEKIRLFVVSIRENKD
jgi:hypothetical protein